MSKHREPPNLWWPDPNVRDSVSLNVAVSQIGGYYSVTVPDSRTKAWGDRLTQVLVDIHTYNRGMKFDDDYTFTSKAVLYWSERLGLNAGMLEALRIGWVRWSAIPEFHWYLEKLPERVKGLYPMNFIS